MLHLSSAPLIPRSIWLFWALLPPEAQMPLFKIFHACQIFMYYNFFLISDFETKFLQL